MRVSSSLVSSGFRQRLTSSTRNLTATFSPRSSTVSASRETVTAVSRSSPAFAPAISLSKPLSSASVNRSTGRTRSETSETSSSFFSSCVDSIATLTTSPASTGSSLGHELAVLREEVLDVLVDVGVGDRADGPLDRQPVVIGQIELGPHFDVELVFEVPFLGNLDRIDIEVGLVDRVEVFVGGELLHAFKQHPLFDLGGQL